MQSPLSVRFPEQLSRKLSRAARKANTPASDIIRLAVAQFLASHTRTNDMIAAVIEGRKQGL